ncbi:MAG: ATP-binding protein [Bacteroidota bacterium]
MSTHPILLEKLNEGVNPEIGFGKTRRDLRLPAIPGKAHAVIGMRRSGKTTFLRQLQAERREATSPEQAVYLSFEDDRLTDLPAAQLSQLLEEFFRRFPRLRGRETVTLYLDEIQLVAGWERFVRRILDSERVEVVLSGSSARLLSREIHTSMRGRSVASVIRPFSFREFLRHRRDEPEVSPGALTPAQRSAVEHRFREYMRQGGFPEAQGLAPDARVLLLQGYVDTVLFRDIVERHGVRQVSALRWLIRHCLRNPGGLVSMHRFYADLRAQGYAVSKDTLHELFAYLSDAFLVSAVPFSADAERVRNTNPRKIYPADPALIHAFAPGLRPQEGHTLETVIMLELERRGAALSYVRTRSGFEVDFLALFPDGKEELIQVCSDPGSPGAGVRELRVLEEASREHPRARKRLLVLEREEGLTPGAPDVAVGTAWAWLLGGESPP